MPYPVLRGSTCYGMSGTAMPYSVVCDSVSRHACCTCYAMIQHSAAAWLWHVRYCYAIRCYVPTRLLRDARY
eukprot:2275377-Rhodomonas_salina.3